MAGITAPTTPPKNSLKGSRLSRRTKSIIAKQKREPGGITRKTARALKAELRTPGVSRREKKLVGKLTRSVRRNTTAGEARGVKKVIRGQQKRSVKRARIRRAAGRKY